MRGDDEDETLRPDRPLDDAEREALFARLVEEHQDRALRLALRFVSGDRAAAEDVVQEAFLRAHRGLARFRGEARLTTWFDRILVREAYRHHRRPWRRWLPGESPEDHARATPALGADALARDRIEAALCSLSSHQRFVFVLVHMEGHTVADVAERMERSEGTVKSHLHRALVRLRSELSDLAPSSSPDDSEEEA